MRRFFSPFQSKSAIGRARYVVYEFYEQIQHDGEIDGQVAAAVEAALHDAHSSWISMDTAFDICIILILIGGIVYSVCKSRSETRHTS